MKSSNTLDEIDVLINKPDRSSIDPIPQRTIGINPKILKDLVLDHINALKRINHGLPSSENLNSLITNLENEYSKIFGQRLTELLNAPDSQVKSAVLELRRKLNNIAKDTGANLSYDNIDSIMTDICKEFNCAPNKLHDEFIKTFDQTPDEYAHSRRNNKHQN